MRKVIQKIRHVIRFRMPGRLRIYGNLTGQNVSIPRLGSGPVMAVEVVGCSNHSFKAIRSAHAGVYDERTAIGRDEVAAWLYRVRRETMIGAWPEGFPHNS